jgi:Xaa-Pro aminopeptidase
LENNRREHMPFSRKLQGPILTKGTHSRLTALRQILKREQLDALVAITIEESSKNVQYLSGFSGTVGAIVVSADDAVLAVDARYTLRAKEESKSVRVIEVAGKRVPSFLSYVSGAIEALGLSPSARIGYEGNRIPVLMARAWEEKYPDMVPTEHLVESLREIKDDAEIACLREAAQKTTEAFLEILSKVLAGARECDVATELDIAIRRTGATKNSFATIVASGPNAASPHHETGERVMSAGDIVVMDFGGTYPGGYCSDITRTVFVPGAEPHPELVKFIKPSSGPMSRPVRL